MGYRLSADHLAAAPAGLPLAALRLHLEQQATVAAYQDCFLLMGILGVLIIPMVVLLRR